MTDYGKKIAELRNASKMTQAELGAMLNVTSQAVSKWENGLSEPDIESIRKICQIFNITFDEFFGAEPRREEDGWQQTTEHTSGVVLAYCDVCDKALYNPKDYQVTIENGVQHTTCLECVPKKAEMKRKAEAERLAEQKKADSEKREAQRRYRQQEEFGRVKKGLIWGVLGAIGLAVLMLIGGISSEEPTWTVILTTLLGAYGGYAMIAQFIWGNSVWNVFGFFLRTLKLPGVIFTLSIDGLLFLIFVKVLGAVLSAIFSVLLFIIGFFVTWFYSMVIFPFALIKELHEIRNMY